MVASRGLVILLLTSGCSAMVTNFEPCTQHKDCRDAFGFGWECESTQFCVEFEPHQRCTNTYPVDLFERRESYRDHVVLGSLLHYPESESYGRAAELAAFLVSDDRTAGPYAMIHCRIEEDLTLDGLTGADAIQSPALWLADNVGVPGIIGPDWSSSTVTAFEVLDATDVFMISPSATSLELVTMDGEEKSDENPGQFWRTAAPDSLQASVIAADMENRSVTHVGLIHSSGSYGTGLAQLFVDEYSGTTVSMSFASEPERDQVIVDIIQKNPSVQEVLFIAPDSVDSAALVNAAGISPLYAGIELFLTDGAAADSFLDETTASTHVYGRVRGTRPAVPSGELWDYFVTSYYLHYDENPKNEAYSASSHDAGWLALYASAAAKYEFGEVTGPGMSWAMRRMSEGELIDLSRGSWLDGLAQLEMGNPIDVEGSSGPLQYDPVTEETTAPIDVWVLVQNGEAWNLETAYTVSE